MIDLGAHGMYLIHELLGLPVGASSAFTRGCENPDAVLRNRDGVEDNAVTVMHFPSGAIAVNETGFLSRHSPVVLEVHGENGYVRMEDNSVLKCTTATGGRPLSVEIPASLPAPLEQFLLGTPHPGCGIEEAIALTKMMEMAYA
jgi:predicted dehydrogenase